MPQITRPAKNIRAFASSAGSGEKTLYADSAVSGDDDGQLLASLTSNFERGVFSVAEQSGQRILALQDFNAVNWIISKLVEYLFQAGVAEWAAEQEYYRGSVARHGATLYLATGPASGRVEASMAPPDNAAQWAAIGSPDASALASLIGTSATSATQALRRNVASCAADASSTTVGDVNGFLASLRIGAVILAQNKSSTAISGGDAVPGSSLGLGRVDGGSGTQGAPPGTWRNLSAQVEGTAMTSLPARVGLFVRIA